MKALTNDEAHNWCTAKGLQVTSRRFLHYALGECNSFTIKLEAKAYQVIALASYLTPTWEEIPFQGALLWMREWDIWNEHAEKTGSKILEQMRLASGERRSLIEAPAMLFGPEELYEMHSFFVLPLLFGWDAFVVPLPANYFVFVSHDEVVEVVAKSRNVYDQMFKILKDWNPQDDRSWYPKHVGTQ